MRAQRPPVAVVGADAELEPGVAGERRPPLAVGPRPAGELPAVDAPAPRAARATVASTPRISTSVGWPPRVARSVTNRPAAPLSTSAVGCARPRPAGNARHLDGAQRTVARDPHALDAAVGGDPRAAATRRHEEANGAGDAVAERRVRASSAPARMRQSSRRPPPTTSTRSRSTGRKAPARRRDRACLAGAEALGRADTAPSAALEPLEPE